jgi:hypothetical protein
MEKEVEALQLHITSIWPNVRSACIYCGKGNNGVDGYLLGSGSRGKPYDRYLQAIEVLNTSEKPILSIDVSSSVDADSGYAGLRNEFVTAPETVTFGAIKPLTQFQGNENQNEHIGILFRLKDYLERIEKLPNAIEKSSATFECGFNIDYIELKFEECKLQYQFDLKKQEESIEQKLIKEQIREEQRAIK